MNSQDRLVFALDVPDRKEAKRYVTMLEGVVGCFKVGLELFIREGPDVVKMIQDHSAANIFLDLKLHDIPATVRRALQSAAKLGIKYSTIHSTEAEEHLAERHRLQRASLGQPSRVHLLVGAQQRRLEADRWLMAEDHGALQDLHIDRACRRGEPQAEVRVCFGRMLDLLDELAAVKLDGRTSGG